MATTLSGSPHPVRVVSSKINAFLKASPHFWYIFAVIKKAVHVRIIQHYVVLTGDLILKRPVLAYFGRLINIYQDMHTLISF
jgi:hypothetical protein